MRAKEGLNKYDDGGINLMGALIYIYYNSDVRVGIRALYLQIWDFFLVMFQNILPV